MNKSHIEIDNPSRAWHSHTRTTGPISLPTFLPINHPFHASLARLPPTGFALRSTTRRSFYTMVFTPLIVMCEPFSINSIRPSYSLTWPPNQKWDGTPDTHTRSNLLTTSSGAQALSVVCSHPQATSWNQYLYKS